jgi:hypothetical protein
MMLIGGIDAEDGYLRLRSTEAAGGTGPRSTRLAAISGLVASFASGWEAGDTGFDTAARAAAGGTGRGTGVGSRAVSAAAFCTGLASGGGATRDSNLEWGLNVAAGDASGSA